MSKDKISDYSATANSNTDIAGINIDEGCAPSGINNAIRTLMKQLKDWQSGSQDVYITPAGSAASPAVTTTGDTNTGIYFPAADTVALSTGGTERARVDSAGNFGLGVTPATKFNIGSGGTFRLNRTDNSATGYCDIVYAGAGVGLKFTDANSEGYRFFNGATQVLTLDTNGNLGLGVTPSAWNTNYNKSFEFGGYGSLTGNTSGVEIDLMANAYRGTSGSYYFKNASSSPAGMFTMLDGSSKQFAWYQSSANGTAGNPITWTQAMTLDTSGNLGLGVTPSAWGTAYRSLEGSFAQGWYYNNAATTTGLTSNAYQNGTNWIYKTTNAAFRFEIGTGADFRWYTAPSGTAGNPITFTQAMTLDASGNLGVGTTSPQAKLHLNTSSAGANVFQITNGTLTLNLGVNNSSGGSYIYESSNNALRFGTNDTERARIDSSGNLLVGTTTVSGVGGITIRPDIGGAGTYGRIEINQNQNADGLTFAYNGTQVGRINVGTTSTTYVTSSDYRLKENIQPMTSALATVAQLNPVTYNWKADGSSGQGFIAHELQAVVPDCVVGEKDAVDADGKPVYQGIDTSFLVATLTAAIQELKAEFDAYKAAHP